MTDHREQAAAVREQFNDAVAHIRDNNTLTRDGKLSALARAHREASDALAQLQRSADAQAVEDRKTWTRQAFAVNASGPHTAVSVRDAYARASAIGTHEEAASLLHQAETTADETLARAVAQRAHDNGWTNVVSDYAAGRPAAAAALGKLVNSATSNPLRERFIDAGTYYLPQPSELSSLPPGMVNRLASGDAA